MSDYRAIQGVTKTLRDLLKRYITDSGLPEFGGLAVHVGPPTALDEESGVSVWLYQVERNAEVLNHPRRRSAPNEQEHQPFPVNLHYLITPHHDEEENAHALLGRILQVLHAFRAVPHSMLVDIDRPFSIHFQPLSLEELTRVWDALKEPYQLSVACLVQLASLDSLRAPERVVPVQHAVIAVGEGAPA